MSASATIGALMIGLRLSVSASKAICGVTLNVIVSVCTIAGSLFSVVILATADVWEIKKRARDLEQIAGVHVRLKPFDMDEMCDLIQRLLADAQARPKRRRFKTDGEPEPASPTV